MTHDEIRAEFEAYVLDRLDEQERAAVRAHLAGCLECRHDVVELRRGRDALPAALSVAAPYAIAPDLRDRVLRAIEAPAMPYWRRPLGAAAAAIVLVVLGSLAWGFAQSQAATQEREQVLRLVGQQEVVFEIVDGRDTVKAALRATQEGSTSYGKLYTRPGFREVVAMTGRLPPPPAGEAYLLWVTREGRETLAGALAMNQTGFGVLVFAAEVEGPRFDAARVTRQARGASAPAGVTVLAWEAGR